MCFAEDGTLASRQAATQSLDDAAQLSGLSVISAANIGTVAASILQPAAGAIMKGFTIPGLGLVTFVVIIQSDCRMRRLMMIMLLLLF